jgi:hypothetical protein
MKWKYSLYPNPIQEAALSPKRRQEDEFKDDDELEDDDDDIEEEEDEDEEEDDDDTIDLDKAEKEEKDDDDDDDEDEEEGLKKSVEEIERQRLFQHEAEDVLENLTMDDVREILKEAELEESLAPRLKKLLVEVINEGDVVTMDEAWEEALERLEE